MDNADTTPVTWRFKRPPFFLVLIALISGFCLFSFGKSWLKSTHIPTISSGEKIPWELQLQSATTVEELRALATTTHERTVKAEHMADSALKLLPKFYRTGVIAMGTILFCAVMLYLEKRWR
jgi:hypothetical protein